MSDVVHGTHLSLCARHLSQDARKGIELFVLCWFRLLLSLILPVSVVSISMSMIHLLSSCAAIRPLGCVLCWCLTALHPRTSDMEKVKKGVVLKTTTTTRTKLYQLPTLPPTSRKGANASFWTQEPLRSSFVFTTPGYITYLIMHDVRGISGYSYHKPLPKSSFDWSS